MEMACNDLMSKEETTEFSTNNLIELETFLKEKKNKSECLKNDFLNTKKSYIQMITQ